VSLDKRQYSERLVDRVRESWARHPNRLILILVFVTGIAVSEAFLFSGRRWMAIWGHFATLVVCLSFLQRGVDATHVQVILLVPLFRLVNLGMPVFFELTVYWFPMIYGPLIPGLVLVDRLNPDLDVPFGWREGLILLPLTIPLGWVLAEVESEILQSAALIPAWNVVEVATITVVMVCFVGFVEEYLFRGLLQPTLQESLGRWPGVLLASALFGLMHSGYGVPAEVLFAGVIGLVFGLIYDYLDSLVFVTVVHGVLNVFLFAVLPIHGSLFPV